MSNDTAMKPTSAFFWQRLDYPGYDDCSLFRLSNGWCLSGAAVFHDNQRPCHLQYEVLADLEWKTRRARVSGFVGRKAVDLRIHTLGRQRWFADGEELQAVEGCLDIDLGFTPATNLLAIRRLALTVGQSAESPAVYLAFPTMRIRKLPQTYHRISQTEFEYSAPSFGYNETLRVAPSGAVTHYPGLFEELHSGRKARGVAGA